MAKKKSHTRMEGWKEVRTRPLHGWTVRHRERTYGKRKEYRDGKLFKEAMYQGLLDELIKIAKSPQHYSKTLPKRLKFVSKPLDKLLERMYRGGPTSRAAARVLERPGRAAWMGAGLGALLGLPIPPPIPGSMTLAPTMALAFEAPRFAKYRRAEMKKRFPRTSTWIRRKLGRP